MWATREELMEKSEGIALEVLERWRDEQKLEPLALTWPEKPVESEEGKLVYGSVICQLQRVPHSEWDKALREMVQVTKAFGLLLIERRDAQIRVIFETAEGARSWITPLQRHGDRLVLGETVVHDNVECIGIMWQSTRGSA